MGCEDMWFPPLKFCFDTFFDTAYMFVITQTIMLVKDENIEKISTKHGFYSVLC